MYFAQLLIALNKQRKCSYLAESFKFLCHEGGKNLFNPKNICVYYTNNFQVL